MGLTPADVHGVAFSKPPIGKRGYNEDEVDAFLDLVEAELSRLLEDNGNLRQQLEQLDQELENARAGDAAALHTPDNLASRRLAAVPPPTALEMTDTAGGDHHVQAAKVLGLAQEMADRLTTDAKAEADGMLAEARTKSEQTLSAAQTKADTMVNEARTRAETMVSDARTKAEALERKAKDKATTLERAAERQHRETLGSMALEENRLKKELDKLRTIEREYRTRLKTVLESSLRDLVERSEAAPADGASRSTKPSTSYNFGNHAEAG